MAPKRYFQLFAILNAADYFLTWHLLTRQSVAYEGNPLAAHCLNSWGWGGLALFKAGLAALAAGIALAVWRVRPRTGEWVLRFGCLVLGGVVTYSAALPWLAPFVKADEEEEVLALTREGCVLDRELARSRRYAQELDAVAGDLASRHFTLHQAVDRLATTDKGHDRVWLNTLRLVGGGDQTDRECLATSIIESALANSREQPEGRRRLARQLAREYRVTFGRPLPRPIYDGKDPGPTT